MPLNWLTPARDFTQQAIIRVRYADTDCMGVVYHANYLQYFESCRTELIRHVWKSYRGIEHGGWFLMVLEAHCRYLQSAKYDDVLIVDGTISGYTETRLRFDYQIRHQESNRLLVDGFTEHCWTDTRGKPCRMPPELKKILRS